MKRQLLKMAHHTGQYTVVRDDSKVANKYIVYRKNWVSGKWKQKKLNEYGDMTSCLHEIIQRISGRTWVADMHIIYQEDGSGIVY